MPRAVPNYLSTAADGTVTADFPGGVAVQAAAFPAGAAPGRSIRWRRQSDGALVAFIVGEANGNTGGILKLAADSPNTLQESSVQVSADNAGAATNRISALANPYGVKLIDGNDTSDFVRHQPSVGNSDIRCSDGFSQGPASLPAGTSLALANTTVPSITGWTTVFPTGGFEYSSGGQEFFTWAFIFTSATNLQIIAHNNHPSATLVVTWRGIVWYTR